MSISGDLGRSGLPGSRAGVRGGTSVQPPVNNTVSIPTVPSKTVPMKTVDAEGKSLDAGGDVKAPPRIDFYPPDELERVVAALASDDPDQQLTRVWIREGAATSADAIDVVLSNSLVTDDGLAKLAGIARLRHLNLDDCREITSAGLVHLAALKDLRSSR